MQMDVQFMFLQNDSNCKGSKNANGNWIDNNLDKNTI